MCRNDATWDFAARSTIVIDPKKYNFPIQPYDWNTSFCACCSDPLSCLYVTCCPVFIDLTANHISDDITSVKCDCYKEDRECFECCSHCCEFCALPAMMCGMMCLYSPLLSPFMSGCVRRDFVRDHFESTGAKESRGGKTSYFQMTNCLIGTCCPTLSNAQIVREFIVRGYHAQRKRLSCSGKGMYDAEEIEAMEDPVALARRKADEEIARLEREAKAKDDEVENMRRRLEEANRECEERRNKLEEAKKKREENDQFQGHFDHRRRTEADAMFEMKADTAFGSM